MGILTFVDSPHTYIMKQFHHRLSSLLFLSGFIFLQSCLKNDLPTAPVITAASIDSNVTELFRAPIGVVAGTGGTSMTLNDGRVLWFYGPSHLNDMNGSGQIACTPNVHNAIALQQGNQWTTVNAPNADAIPSNEANTWFEPLHAYQFFDTVFVFAKKVGTSAQHDTYIAKFRFPDMQFLRTDSIGTAGTSFGYSVVVDTAIGFCYIYGLHQPSLTSQNDLFLARFSMNNPHSPWLYYSTSGWVNVSSAALPLTTVPGENVSVRKVKGKYILLTQDAGKTCNQGTGISSSIGADAWGPFNNPTKLYTISDKINGVTPVTFGACLQPQWLNNSNEIIVTYSMDGYAPCVTTCTNGYDEADYHRLKAIRVSLKNIDPTY